MTPHEYQHIVQAHRILAECKVEAVVNGGHTRMSSNLLGLLRDELSAALHGDCHPGCAGGLDD